MTDSDQLDRDAFARLAGYSTPGTVTRLLYRARKKRNELTAAGSTDAAASPSLFPEPDGAVGRTPYWLRSTVDRYLQHRTPLGGGGWLPGPGDHRDEEADEAGPGNCPICKQPFQSVSAHRRRRAACSYDPSVRADAAVVLAERPVAV